MKKKFTTERTNVLLRKRKESLWDLTW